MATLSVSHADAGPFRMTLTCAKTGKYVFVYTQTHSVESTPVVKAHESLLAEGSKQIFFLKLPGPSRPLQRRHKQTFNLMGFLMSRTEFV